MGQDRPRDALRGGVGMVLVLRTTSRVRMSSGYRAMKARELALRLKRFEVDEKARKVADLEYMIRDFEGMAADLNRQIEAEEGRTGIKDPTHFAYSTFAKSASQRRDNLRASAEGLKVKLEAERAEHQETLEQLARAEAPGTREELRSRRRADGNPSALVR